MEFLLVFLLFLFTPAILVLLLYLGWLWVLYWLYRQRPTSWSVRERRVWGSLFLLAALLPLTRIFMGWLLAADCSLRGGARWLQPQAQWPVETHLQVPAHLSSFGRIAEVLATRQLDAVYLHGKTGISTPDLPPHPEDPARMPSLRPAQPDDLACGPWFFWLRGRGAYKGYPTPCPALSHAPLPEQYLRVTEEKRREYSLLTAFHPVDWTVLRVEQVTPAGVTALLETRSFFARGLLPLTVFSPTVARCSAGMDPWEMIQAVLQPRADVPELQTLTPDWARQQFQSLQQQFWGYTFPAEVDQYQITLSGQHKDMLRRTAEAGAIVQLQVAEHPRPVLLELDAQVPLRLLHIQRQQPEQQVLIETPNPIRVVPDLRPGEQWLPAAKAAEPLAAFFIEKSVELVRGHHAPASRDCGRRTVMLDTPWVMLQLECQPGK